VQEDRCGDFSQIELIPAHERTSRAIQAIRVPQARREVQPECSDCGTRNEYAGSMRSSLAEGGGTLEQRLRAVC
jgi:hypothetical protein